VELKRLESTHRRLVRLVTRACVLVAGVVFALGVLPWRWTSMVLPALSPYVVIGAAIAGRTVTAVTPIGLMVAAIALFRPRWLCRVLCPVGLLIEQVGRLRPKARPRLARVPPFGQWIVLLTLAGALVGYPLLLWLDPMLVLLLGVLWPFVWCRRICPLGATQDLLALLRRIVRRRVEHPLHHAPAERRRNPLPRRTVLAMVAGAGAAVAASRWAHGGTRPLRPPGAIAEERFTGLCIRCGNCVRACPEKIVQPDLGLHGVAGLLAPVVTFDYAYCQPDCNLCTQVCPSGAIVRLSLAEKEKAIIGLARVDMLACFLSQNIECAACAGACPYQAIRIDFNEDDYTSTIHIDPDACNGCGACEVICMTSPAKAIRVHPR